MIFAGTNGYADGVPLDKMAQWQADLIRFMATSYPEVGRDIVAKKAITDDNRAALDKSPRSFPSRVGKPRLSRTKGLIYGFRS